MQSFDSATTDYVYQIIHELYGGSGQNRESFVLKCIRFYRFFKFQRIHFQEKYFLQMIRYFKT